MVEIWLKYGRTEIFADLGDNARIEQPPKAKPDFSQNIQEALASLGGGELSLVVDYVAGIDGYDTILRNLATQLSLHGTSLKDLKTWLAASLYNSGEVEGEIVVMVSSEVRSMGIEKVAAIGDGEPSEASILLAPSIFWGGDIVTPASLLGKHGLGDPEVVISPVIGRGGYVAEVIVGKPHEIETRAREAVQAFSKFTVAPDFSILVLGGPGHPTDLCLSTSIPLISSVDEALEDKVIIFPVECHRGLGPSQFVEQLVSGGGDSSTVHARWLSLWGERAERNKICMVTALPSTLVEKLLGARQADTLDEAMTYAWRLKSKEAGVLVVRNVLGARLVLEEPRNGDK